MLNLKSAFTVPKPIQYAICIFTKNYKLNSTKDNLKFIVQIAMGHLLNIWVLAYGPQPLYSHVHIHHANTMTIAKFRIHLIDVFANVAPCTFKSFINLVLFSVHWSTGHPVAWPVYFLLFSIFMHNDRSYFRWLFGLTIYFSVYTLVYAREWSWIQIHLFYIITVYILYTNFKQCIKFFKLNASSLSVNFFFSITVRCKWIEKHMNKVSF